MKIIITDSQLDKVLKESPDRVEENLKLKRTLQKLFENQEFETLIEDLVSGWSDGDEDDSYYDQYFFKYYCVIDTVLGQGSKSVVSIDIVITEFTINDHDHLFDSRDWYHSKLEDLIYKELFSDFPVSFYFEFYTKEEYNK